MDKNLTLRNYLLVCGILASLLWVGTDIIAGTIWTGYNFVDQAVSELSAIGAPTRLLVTSLLFVYSILVILFGLGIQGASAHSRALRVIAVLFILNGVLGFVGYFFPLQLGVEEATFTNTVHSLIAGVNGISFLIMMGLGAFVLGQRFRFFSIGTLLGLIVVGAVMSYMAGVDIINQGFTAPPRWFGLLERIDIYVSMLWAAILALVLSRVNASTRN